MNSERHIIQEKIEIGLATKEDLKKYRRLKFIRQGWRDNLELSINEKRRLKRLYFLNERRQKRANNSEGSEAK